MPGINTRLARVVLCIAATFLTVPANAMQVPQYDQMVKTDRNHFITLLLKGAVEALDAHGKSEQSKKLISLFNDFSDKGGISQFEENLQFVRVANAKKATDPNNKDPVYEVEHAMALTLKQDGIIVPIKVLLEINKDFKPAYPPSSK